MSRTFEALKKADAERMKRLQQESQPRRRKNRHSRSSGFRDLFRRAQKAQPATPVVEEGVLTAPQPIVLKEPEDGIQGGSSMLGQEKKDMTATSSSPSPIIGQTYGETIKDAGRFSVLQKGLTFRGEINGTQGLRIQGSLDGEISVTGEVLVEAGAEVNASIIATRIVIGGSVTGGVIASGKVEIVATGSVQGIIQGKPLLVHEGATLAGEVRVGDAMPDGQDEKEAATLSESTSTLSVGNGSDVAVPASTH